MTTLMCMLNFKYLEFYDSIDKKTTGLPRKAGISAVTLSPPDFKYPKTPTMTRTAPYKTPNIVMKKKYPFK